MRTGGLRGGSGIPESGAISVLLLLLIVVCRPPILWEGGSMEVVKLFRKASGKPDIYLVFKRLWCDIIKWVLRSGSGHVIYVL